MYSCRRLSLVLFPYHSIWIFLKFTNCALLWLILNRFPDMSSKVQLHLSGGTKGERELPRGLGCLPVMADILRKETLPQRDTEREQFYRELMTCVLPVTGIMPWALNPSTNMQNNLLSRYHHYCHSSGNTIEVQRKPRDLDRTSEKTRSVFSLSPRRYWNIHKNIVSVSSAPSESLASIALATCSSFKAGSLFYCTHQCGEEGTPIIPMNSTEMALKVGREQ